MGFYVTAPIAEIRVAKIVGKDDDDIGLHVRGLRAPARSEQMPQLGSKRDVVAQSNPSAFKYRRLQRPATCAYRFATEDCLNASMAFGVWPSANPRSYGGPKLSDFDLAQASRGDLLEPVPYGSGVDVQLRKQNACIVPFPEADADASLDDDICPVCCRLWLYLGLFGLRHSELVERLLEIIEESLPLGRRDHKIFVRVLHGAASVLLRSAGSPAEHFRNEVFEACRRNAMMGLVYPWVRVQAGIDHDPVDKVIDHGGDAVEAPSRS